MKKLHAITLSALATIGTSETAQAQVAQPASGYWVDSQGVVVRNSWRECWRNSAWTAELALPECEGGMPAKPQAKAMPAPIPAPAPEPAPVVAPVPVAEPAPAPEATESWVTKTLEKPVRLEGASFATGSSRLLAGAGSKLDEVAQTATEHPQLELTVSGYTDSTGSAKGNLRLSQARADAVKAYLVGKGVAASRIRAQGFGSANPVADNGTAAGRATNRRVEVQYTVTEQTRVRVTK